MKGTSYLAGVTHAQMLLATALAVDRRELRIADFGFVLVVTVVKVVPFAFIGVLWLDCIEVADGVEVGVLAVDLGEVLVDELELIVKALFFFAASVEVCV